MSLEAKLANLSNQLEAKKQEQLQIEEEERLKPIRERVKELENQWHQLDIIKGSLEFKSGQEKGLGMAEYAKETDEQLKQKTNKIDGLITKHSAALQELNIKDRDELVAKEDFANEPEVVEFKTAVGKTAEINLSDAALQTKLADLGIALETDKFSYEAAAKAVTEKMEILEKELTQEKIKTPEGREEVIVKLAEKFDNTLPKIKLFSYPERQYEFELTGTNDNHFRAHISIHNNKANFDKWWDARLVSGDVTKLEKEYGRDIVDLAIKKTYNNKFSAAIKLFDEQHANVLAFNEHIKKISPAEKEKTRELLKEYGQVKNDLGQALVNKSKEFKQKGIDFSPTHAAHYGGNYMDYAKLINWGDIESDIIKAINGPDKLTDDFDYIKLQKLIPERIDSIKRFTEVIKGLETKEDIAKLLRGTNGRDELIGKFHQELLHTPEWRDLRFHLSSNYLVEEEITNKYKTYTAVQEYITRKIKEYDSAKQLALSEIEAVLATKAVEAELNNLIKQEKFCDYIRDIEGKIDKINQDKRDAQKLLDEIKTIENTLLPDEKLTLNDGTITIRSIVDKREEARNTYRAKDKELDDLKKAIPAFEYTQPKFFGKDKWQTELTSMKNNQKILEEELKNLNKEINDLYNKSHIYLVKRDDYGSFYTLVKTHKAEGTTKEIFTGLKQKLQEMVDKKPPEAIVSLYNKYNELVKKI